MDDKTNLAWKKSPHDLWNLLNLTPKQLEVIYPECKYITNTQHKYKRLLRQGKLTMPPTNPEYDGNPEAERERSRARRGKVAPSAGKTALEMTTIQVPVKHKHYHEAIEKHLANEGMATSARFSDYQMGMKNAEGEFESHDLKASKFEVKFNVEPEWPVVTRVESVKLPKKEAKEVPGRTKQAVILPDLQIPFQSPEAVSIALQIVQDTKPDKIVILGDMLDLSAWGKYEQRPEYAVQTQDAIIQAHILLATLRKLSPSAEIVVMAGNHEKRMETALLRNAQAAFGLKRADQPEGWPVMSVPYLCAFDTLDVEYVDAYPASRYWINERLQVRHGNIARPGGKTAVAVSNDERVSTIFGHIHRIESQYKTVNVYGGGRISGAYAIGALCKIDGHVPSTKSAHHLDGQPAVNYENWQNGLAVVSYEDGDAPFNVEQVYINTFGGYQTNFRGKLYEPIGSEL